MQAIASGHEQPVAGKGPKAVHALMTNDTTPWYAIWTNSHCEQLVNDQLAGKGFELFFPKTWRDTQPGSRRVAEKPLFPGYLFVHCEMDKHRYIDIIKARGVVRILGERWDALAPIPHHEIDAIQRALTTGPVVEHPHLAGGDRVRITAGPLEGVTGIFVRSKPLKGLLVLSIDLLQRSVAVEVPASLVEPE